MFNFVLNENTCREIVSCQISSNKFEVSATVKKELLDQKKTICAQLAEQKVVAVSKAEFKQKADNKRKFDLVCDNFVFDMTLQAARSQYFIFPTELVAVRGPQAFFFQTIHSLITLQ